MSHHTGREPSLPQPDRPTPPPQPTGAEPGMRAEYALLEVLLTLGDLDPAEREAALELLLELGEKAVPALVRASQEQRRDSRLAAAHAMGILGHAEFLPELGRLLRDEDEWVRTTALGGFLRLVQAHDDLATLVEVIRAGLPPDSLNTLAAGLHWRRDFVPRLLEPDTVTPEFTPLLVRLVMYDGRYAHDARRAILRMGMEALPGLLEALPLVREWSFRYNSGALFDMIGSLAERCPDPDLRAEVVGAMYDASAALYPRFDRAIIGVLRRLDDVPLTAALLDRVRVNFPPHYAEFSLRLIALLVEMGDSAAVPAIRRWGERQAFAQVVAEALKRLHQNNQG